MHIDPQVMPGVMPEVLPKVVPEVPQVVPEVVPGAPPPQVALHPITAALSVLNTIYAGGSSTYARVCTSSFTSGIRFLCHVHSVHMKKSIGKRARLFPIQS